MASPTPSRRELLADGAVSIQRACELSGLSRSTICRRIASGELASTRVGRRRLVPRRALLDYLARGLEPRALAKDATPPPAGEQCGGVTGAAIDGPIVST